MSFSNTSILHGIPFHALRVFDAAARHGAMLRAAKELGLTQGAVSRHVKNLEERLDAVLFKRGPRGLTLTEEGDLLADYVRRSLQELETGLARIGQPRQRTTLVVASARSFALRVLAPRLPDFARRYPWIDLRLDTHRYFADLGKSSADVAIRAGDGHWSEYSVERLTKDILFPVCAPALWSTGNSSEPEEDFLRRQLLYHYAERPYWPTWLQAVGFDSAIGAIGPSFGESSLMLAAAESGQGLAIGRASLVADALARGALVKPFAEGIDDGISYYLVKPKASVESTTIKAFSEWLLQQMTP